LKLETYPLKLQPLILTAIGLDRPGLVEELSATVARHGGNWLEARMARLGGEFVGIVRIEIDDDKSESLICELATLDGLTVTARESTAATARPTASHVDLQLLGADRQGIVSEITSVLAAHGVNVEHLDTERLSAPMSGEHLFKATARLGLPTGLEASDLQTALEQLAADLMVDITLADAS